MNEGAQKVESADSRSRSSTLLRLGREALAGLVVVFLLFGPYLSQFLRVGPHLEDMKKGRNALWFLWQPHDKFVLFGFIVVLTGTAVAIREVLRASGRKLLLRAFDHAFVVALGAGVLTNLWFHAQRPHGYHIGQFGMEIQTAWLLLVAVTAFSFARDDSRLVRMCGRACQIVSPAVLIVAWQLIGLPSLPQRMDSLAPPVQSSVVPASDTNAPDRPVYLFIFDEWSYRRTYEQGQVRSALPHLAEISKQATTFHRAHSPGPGTLASIPRLLRGTTDQPQLLNLQTGFMRGNEFVASKAYPSVFERAGCQDYRKIMVQWGFAVSLWAADSVDIARTYACYPRGGGPLREAGLHLYNAAFFWTDPWSILVYEKLRPQVEDEHLLQMYRRIDADVLNIIRNQPARTFAVIHHPLPHPPYLLDADGSYDGRDPSDHITSNAEGYEKNLICMDRAVGRFVTELRSTGRFDECLLILTSDHSWRQDPATPDAGDEELTHVPLIVKSPGQTEPMSIRYDFRTCNLGEFIGQLLRQHDAAPSLAATASR